MMRIDGEWACPSSVKRGKMTKPRNGGSKHDEAPIRRQQLRGRCQCVGQPPCACARRGAGWSRGGGESHKTTVPTNDLSSFALALQTQATTVPPDPWEATRTKQRRVSATKEVLLHGFSHSDCCGRGGLFGDGDGRGKRRSHARDNNAPSESHPAHDDVPQLMCV